jgi:hypothetical protein
MRPARNVKDLLSGLVLNANFCRFAPLVRTHPEKKRAAHPAAWAGAMSASGDPTYGMAVVLVEGKQRGRER